MMPMWISMKRTSGIGNSPQAETVCQDTLEAGRVGKLRAISDSLFTRLATRNAEGMERFQYLSPERSGNVGESFAGRSITIQLG